MKKDFTVPYMIGGILAMAAMMNPSTAANNNDQTKDNANDSTALKKEIVISAPDTVSYEEVKPHATEAYARNGDVIYILNNGDKIRRSRGSLAWRNNNPGNIVYGKFARDNGAIGQGANKYAAFPDRETGYAAVVTLLHTDKYRKLTLQRAMAIYADPKVLNRYLAHLKKSTGMGPNTKVGSMTENQINSLADAICVMEGWKEGVEFQGSNGMMMADAQEKAIQNRARQRTR